MAVSMIKTMTMTKCVTVVMSIVLPVTVMIDDCQLVCDV